MRQTHVNVFWKNENIWEHTENMKSKKNYKKHSFFSKCFIFFLLFFIAAAAFYIKVLYLLYMVVNGFESIIIVSVCRFHHAQFEMWLSEFALYFFKFGA